jgi:AraC-like DNA-binding protein
MSIPSEVLLLTSGVGALQSAFFGVYLFTLKKGRQLTTLLLAFLLLAFAIRMTKSVTYVFADGHDVPRLLQNMGYAANLAILPLLWLYLNAFVQKDFQFLWKRHGVHLIPPALAILLSPVLTPYFWMHLHGYTLSLILMGVYLPFCFYLVHRHFDFVNRSQKIWVIGLSVGVTVVWAGYAANFILHLVPYITAPVLFSFVIYFLSYLGLRENNIFVREAKYQSSAFSSVEIARCFDKLQELMTSAHPFKDPSLSLPKLARQLNVSTHLLSETINKTTCQNFSDFINGYRIREATILLNDPKNIHQKIAAIAFETGFNSLSSFNASFKKMMTMTPSEYRKNHTRA